MIELDKIYNLDCFIGLQDIPDGTVDCIITDPPYNITQAKWDVTIPLDLMWKHLLRIAKPNAPFLFFSAQPFTTDLINSQRGLFKYEIIYEKTQKTGFYNAHKAPLRAHENILVFYRRQPTYNPIKYTVPKEMQSRGRTRKNSDYKKTAGMAFGRVSQQAAENYRYTDDGSRFPTDIIRFSNWNGALFGKIDNSHFHPTQKPVELLEYLIKTYTNPGDLILDPFMGSASTAVAAINTGRHYYGYETDGEYYAKSLMRLQERNVVRELGHGPDGTDEKL